MKNYKMIWFFKQTQIEVCADKSIHHLNIFGLRRITLFGMFNGCLLALHKTWSQAIWIVFWNVWHSMMNGCCWYVVESWSYNNWLELMIFYFCWQNTTWWIRKKHQGQRTMRKFWPETKFYGRIIRLWRWQFTSWN